MKADKPVLFSDPISRILAAESIRRQKTPQDLLSAQTIPGIVWDAGLAAINSLNQRVTIGAASYPEGLISIIEDESKYVLEQRAAAALLAQAGPVTA